MSKKNKNINAKDFIDDIVENKVDVKNESVSELQQDNEKPKIKYSATNENGLMAVTYDWVRCFLFAVTIVIFFLTFVFRLVDVEGTSMYSTLDNNDKVIVSNLFYTPQNQDIVVISHGEKYPKPIIKRVIATEGQTVELDYENDRLIVNGIVIDEPYITGTTFSDNIGDNEIPEVIPEGKVFVMGDNRGVSLDSRSVEVGLIDAENVIGKAQFVVFPFSNFGYLY